MVRITWKIHSNATFAVRMSQNFLVSLLTYIRKAHPLLYSIHRITAFRHFCFLLSKTFPVQISAWFLLSSHSQKWILFKSLWVSAVFELKKWKLTAITDHSHLWSGSKLISVDVIRISSSHNSFTWGGAPGVVLFVSLCCRSPESVLACCCCSDSRLGL